MEFDQILSNSYRSAQSKRKIKVKTPTRPAGSLRLARKMQQLWHERLMLDLVSQFWTLRTEPTPKQTKTIQECFMRHDKTKKMMDYWLNLWREAGALSDSRGRIIWPERNAIQPMHCAELLGDMFILDVANGASHYRLAGTRLCATMGRELKDEEFKTAFVDEDQRAAESWATGLVQDDYAVLICSDASTSDGRIVPLETLLLPLNHQGKRDQRALGLTVPLDMPNWIASTPIAQVAIRSVRILTPWEDLGTKTTDEASSVSTLSFANTPGIETEIVDEVASNAPLVDDEGLVRSAPFLRVLDGGRR